jgi:hypothetical protein
MALLTSESIKELQFLYLNQENKTNAIKHGLTIVKASWEDPSRNKDSCFGPYISDMTLAVRKNDDDEKAYMPMIRCPNFSDKTTDLPLDMFVGNTGNEPNTGVAKTKILLRDYLKARNLYSERDESVLTSAQYCVVPEGKHFAPQIFSYQSSKQNPAVLVILISNDGISAQLITEQNQQILFNQNGNGFDFVAKRLSRDRMERKVEDLTAPMTEAEQEQNCLMIIQVPLEVPIMRSRSFNFPSSGSFSGPSSGSSGPLKAKKSKPMSKKSKSVTNIVPPSPPPSYASQYPEPEPEEEVCDVSFDLFGENMDHREDINQGMEDAILSLGSFCHRLTTIDWTKVKRDTQYPIRATFQFYQISNIQKVPEQVFANMAKTIKDVYSNGKASGSLVTEGNTKRETESDFSDLTKTQALTHLGLENAKGKNLFGKPRSLISHVI